MNKNFPWWEIKANALINLATQFEDASRECEAAMEDIPNGMPPRPLYSVGQALCEFIAFELRERAEQVAKTPPAPPDFSNERFTQRRK